MTDIEIARTLAYDDDGRVESLADFAFLIRIAIPGITNARIRELWEELS